MHFAIHTIPYVTPADATAYTAGDLVGNDASAANFAPIIFNAGSFFDLRSGWLRRANLRMAAPSISIANGTFNLDLFKYRPTVANGDNGVLAVRPGPQGQPLWITRLQGNLVLATDAEAYGQLTPGGLTNAFDVPVTLDRDRRGLPDEGLFGVLSAGAGYTKGASPITINISLEFDAPST